MIIALAVNIVLAVAVIAAVVGHHLWAIRTQHHDAADVARVTARRRHHVVRGEAAHGFHRSTDHAHGSHRTAEHGGFARQQTA